MNKILLTSLTIVTCLASIHFSWFNIPFTPTQQETYLPQAAHECALHQLDAQRSMPFGADFGKFIKESALTDTDYQIKTIVLDAGHGGKDPGCSGKKSREKDIALGIALKIGQKIERSYPQLRVIYTRDRDVFVPLHRRASIANDNDADLFISIHCNYIRGSSVTRGSETYVMGLHTAEENLAVAKRENEAILFEEDYENIYGIDPNSDAGHILYNYVQNAFLDQSLSFASKVEDQIAKHEQRRSRGVKQAGFQVLRETAMPSVLVETGFLSNSTEENYLLTHGGQQGVAESVFRAFQAYKHEVEDASKTTEGIATSYESPSIEVYEAPIVYVPTPKESLPKTAPVIVEQKEAAIASHHQRNSDVVSRSSIANRPVRTPVPTPTPSPRVSRRSIDWEDTAASPSQIDETPVRDAYATETFKRPKEEDLRAKAPIEFRVQITASPTPLDQRSGRWLALNSSNYWAEPIWEESQHKYQIMNIQNFNEAEKIRLKMREIGFFNAFVIAYQGMKQLSVNDAMKMQGR